jgi:RHS repeat-associated protein
MLGVDVSGTIYGAQAGANKLGLYHCWNRYYDPAVGRWITPDAIATPFWSLLSYSGMNPITRSDSNGLHPCDIINSALSQWLIGWGDDVGAGAVTCERLCGWYKLIASRPYNPTEAACLKEVQWAMGAHGCANCEHAHRKSNDPTVVPPPRPFSGPYDTVRYKLLGGDPWGGNPDDTLGDGVAKALASIPVCVSGCGKAPSGAPGGSKQPKNCADHSAHAVMQRIATYLECIAQYDGNIRNETNPCGFMIQIG